MRPQTALFFIFLLLSIPCPLAFASQGGDFSIYNPDGNGCSIFRTLIEEEGLKVRTILTMPYLVSRFEGSAIFIIIGSSRNWNEFEVSGVVDFVRRGGSLLIADSKGTSNALTQKMGFLFDGARLIDIGCYVKNPYYPLIDTIYAHEISTNINQLILNHPTGIFRTKRTEELEKNLYNVKVIAESSSLSWVDKASNRKWGYYTERDSRGRIIGYGLEPLSYIAVVETFQLGEGRVVLVSDPTLFTNEMIKYGDNLIFAKNIVRWLSYDSTEFPVIFQEAPSNLPGTNNLFVWTMLWITPFLGPIIIISLFALVSILFIEMKLVGEPPYVSPMTFFEKRKSRMRSSLATYYLYKVFKRRLVEILHLPLHAEVDLILAKLAETFPEKIENIEYGLREMRTELDMVKIISMKPLRIETLTEYPQTETLLRECGELSSRVERIPEKNLWKFFRIPLDLYLVGEYSWEHFTVVSYQEALQKVTATRKIFDNLLRRLIYLSKELELEEYRSATVKVKEVETGLLKRLLDWFL